MEGKSALRCVKRIGNANVFEADELLSLIGGRKPVMARLAESPNLTIDDIKEAEQPSASLQSKDQ
jgi:hypothetical protein